MNVLHINKFYMVKWLVLCHVNLPQGKQRQMACVHLEDGMRAEDSSATRLDGGTVATVEKKWVVWNPWGQWEGRGAAETSLLKADMGVHSHH